jgi:murein DD-endopeptidase MepM/ murein hydrolase activator NlpD
VLSCISFASVIQEDIWWKGESLITFLDKHKIPKNVYFDLSKTDKELCSEIYAGVKYQILYDSEQNKLQQVLIPISQQMQIHIYKDNSDKYTLDIIPINFQEMVHTIFIPIEHSPYEDIIINTNNKKLANEFIRSFKRTVDYKRIQKGDILAIKYIQKTRYGRYFGVPNILAAKIEVNGRAHYMFQNKKDKRYYDLKGRSFTSFFLKVPLRYSRVSSRFTHKRWHPILKKYRAHLGVDYAAPIGRKVFAAADGKVIFKGRKGGYGKTVIIRHKDGYKSLYAHMNQYGKIRAGQWIKQGRHIGYVGNTGNSTGPHLHFGLYKNGNAINPSRVLSVTKTKLTGKSKKVFLEYAKQLKSELNQTQVLNEKYQKLDDFKLSYKIDIDTKR